MKVALVICSFLVLRIFAWNKTDLYDRYPQLTANTTDMCVRAMNNYLINMRSTDDYKRMILSSLHGINDLGSRNLCD